MYWKATVVLLVALIYIKLNPNTDTAFNPDSHVRGHNVLVTGASSGIGEQLAYTYAKMGANVYITARREELLQKVVAHCREIGAEGAKFGYTAADMEIYELAASDVIQDAVSLLGGLDQVILNHAILPPFSRWEGTQDDLMTFEKVIEVNFISVVHLAALSLPYLKESHGKLAIISSIGGKLGMPYLTAYSSSKFALDGFFSTLRQEFNNHRENVSITVCFPGMIETDQANSIFDQFYTDYNIDKDKMDKVMARGSVADTAETIAIATATGQRECYYPLILGSHLPWRVMAAIRNLWPRLLDFDLATYSK